MLVAKILFQPVRRRVLLLLCRRRAERRPRKRGPDNEEAKGVHRCRHDWSIPLLHLRTRTNTDKPAFGEARGVQNLVFVSSSPQAYPSDAGASEAPAASADEAVRTRCDKAGNIARRCR